MRNPGSYIAVSAAAAAFMACQAAEPAPTSDGRVAIAIAPLALSSLVDVVYDLRVSTAQGATVWSRSGLRASTYGDGTGLAFVGPCDASPNVQPNIVSVDIVALYDANGLVPAGAWTDPTASAPLTRSVVCVPNSDVAVEFNVTVARSAKQGFFDVAIAMDDIFCSAKFDCDTASKPLELVQTMDGERVPSAVLGFACTAGPGQDTWLYLDDLTLTCGGVTTVIPVDGGPGNLYQADPGAPAPLYQAMVFRGVEALTDGQSVSLQKRYVNVALAVDFAQTSGACTLTGMATAHDGALSDNTTPAGAYPVVRFEVPLVNAAGSAYGCGQLALDAPGGQVGNRVATSYAMGPPGERFDVGFGVVGGALVAERGDCIGEPPEDLCSGVCALQPPVCDAGHWKCSGFGYEPVEVSCDGFDNDCDGAVDEDDICATSCDDGSCQTCSPNLAAITANASNMADIDFDYDCNAYLTTNISGPDFTTRITPSGTATRFYGNANQNMVFGLVDTDPANRRVVVTYSCCPGCGCAAQNGLTLLYTCAPGDPGCGCAGQTHCPGFLDTAFITTGAMDTSVTTIATPTGLAAGPGNRYYVGNFRANMCHSGGGCVACDASNPDHWCTPSGNNCCAPQTLGQLVEFTLPSPGVEPKWRLAHDFGSEQVIGLASARDGSVLVGTYVSGTQGKLWRYDPVTRAATLLATFPQYVFSVTQNRHNGDIYVELGGSGDPRVFRLLEDGTPAALNPGIPSAPSGRGAIQYAPDGKIYRMQFVGGPVTVWDLSPLPRLLHLSADAGVTLVGGAVSAWADQGGKDNGVTQATATRRPLVVADAINGHPVMRFDGSNDMFQFASNLFASTLRAWTTVMVMRTSDTSAHVLGTGSSSSGFLTSYGNAMTLTGTGAATAKANSNSSGLHLVGANVANGAPHVVVITVANGASSVRVDGGVPVTSTAAVNPYTYSVSTIGASDGSGTSAAQDPFAGDIAEIYVFPTAISAINQAELDQLVSALATKYGITLSP